MLSVRRTSWRRADGRSRSNPRGTTMGDGMSDEEKAERQRRVTEVFGEGTVVDADQDAGATEVAVRHYGREDALDRLWRDRAIGILDRVRAKLAERPPCVIA